MENLTDAEMMEVRALIVMAQDRLGKLQQLAKQPAELTDRFDMRMALADAATPLNAAAEGLE